MTDTEEARIRQQAYEIWMDEGTPGDRAAANWLQAEVELAREAKATRAEPSRPRRNGGSGTSSSGAG
jgi:hypothetical protein